MDLSLFLARSWGVFLVLVCLGLLINKKRFISILEKLHDETLFVIGLLMLGIGVVQVVGYEVWSVSWMGLLTLFGWISLLKGVLILFVPGYAEKFIKLAIKEHLYMLSLIVGLIAGGYLLYVGYIIY